MRYFLLLAFAASLAAQEKLVETIEVKVANVDVVVTDRTGHPVHGLTKDDFELLENGKPQTITNFYEIAPATTSGSVSAVAPNAPATTATPATAPATAAPEDLRARRFVICLDNYSLEPVQRNGVITALRKFVDANMRPGDEMSLILWARNMETVTPLTNDKAAILRGIDSILSHSRTGTSAGQEDERARQDCRQNMQEVDQTDPDATQSSGSTRSGVRTTYTWEQAYITCEGGINAFADSQWQNSRALVADIKTMVSTLAGIDGRKVLVLAGASFPEHPGREALLWLQQQFVPYQKFLKQTKININRGFGQSGARSQTLSMVDLGRYANANGVSFYMIDAHDTRDALSADKPSALDEGDPHVESFMSFTDTASDFHALAAITGGAALSNTQNFNAAFETLERDLSSFYSIGYKPNASSGERTLSVRVKKAGLVARARQSYTPKSSDEEMNDRVVANLFHHGAAGEWPIKVTAKTPEKEGERFAVPLTIEMPAIVTLVPQEQKLVGGFVLYLVVGTKEGARSKVSKNARKIEVPAGGEAELRAKPMTFNLKLMLDPGDNIVSVGVADQISNATGFDRVEVAAK
jgi:VWFA-related protein